MASPQHQVFAIPELLYKILSPDNFPTSSNDPLTIALVCRDWSQHGIDLIWRTIYTWDLQHIWTLIGETKWHWTGYPFVVPTYECEFVVPPAPDEHTWNKVLFYTHRVREVRTVVKCDGHMEQKPRSYAAIFRDLPTIYDRNLFPNLESLLWEQVDLELSMGTYALFKNPSLTVLKYGISYEHRMHNGRIVETFLNTLNDTPNTMPNLQTFAVGFYITRGMIEEWNHPVVRGTFLRTLPRMVTLRHLHLAGCSPFLQIFAHVAWRLPVLETFAAEDNDEISFSMEREAVPEISGQFPDAFHSVTLNHRVSALVSLMSQPHWPSSTITSLTLRTSANIYPETLEALYELCNTIAQFQVLEHLGLLANLNSYHGPHVPLPDILRNLYPLRHLKSFVWRNPRQVEWKPTKVFEESDVLELIQAWPEMEELALGNKAPLASPRCLLTLLELQKLSALSGIALHVDELTLLEVLAKDRPGKEWFRLKGSIRIVQSRSMDIETFLDTFSLPRGCELDWEDL